MPQTVLPASICCGETVEMLMYDVQFPKLGLEFELNPVAFQFGPIQIGPFEFGTVYWYGIIIALGLVLAFLYASVSCKKMKINEDKLINCVIVGVIFGMIGARLYYVIFYPGDTYRNDPLQILNIHQGGLGIYGGIITALAAGAITAKICKMRVGAVLDVASLGFLIGQGIGRWGNFFNQEAFGGATDLPWGMISSATQEIVPDSPVHPCFLYESIWCLVGFALLHVFTRKMRRYDGQTFLLYLVWYGLGRFFIEGLRQDSLIIPGTSLRVSQVVALTSVLAAVVLLIVFRSRTSLSGCGAKEVVAMNAVVDEVPDAKEQKEEEDDGKSTIFGDLPYEQLITETGAAVTSESKREEKEENIPAQKEEAEAWESEDKTEETEEKEEKADGKAD